MSSTELTRSEAKLGEVNRACELSVYSD